MVSAYWTGDDLLSLFRELVPDIVRIIEDFPKDCMRKAAYCFGIFFENSKYRWNCTAIPVETADFCEDKQKLGLKKGEILMVQAIFRRGFSTYSASLNRVLVFFWEFLREYSNYFKLFFNHSLYNTILNPGTSSKSSSRVTKV